MRAQDDFEAPQALGVLLDQAPRSDHVLVRAEIRRRLRSALYDAPLSRDPRGSGGARVAPDRRPRGSSAATQRRPAPISEGGGIVCS